MANSLTKQTFIGFFWQFGGTVFKTILQLGVLAILARLISKEDFGVVQSALIVLGLAKLISQMGVGPALVQSKNLTNLHIRAGTTLTLVLSILLFLLVFISSGVVADFFRMPSLIEVIRVVAIIFILEGATTVSQSLLLRQMKQKILVQIDFVSYVIGYGVVAVILSYYGFGLWSLIAGQIIQSLLKCILSFIKCPHSIKPYWGKKEINELMYFGGGFTVARLFNYIANEGDNIITGRYLGSGALGVYSRAYSIMVKPVNLIGNSIDKVLFPSMAARQNQPDRLTEAFVNGSKMITFLCIPISCIILFSSQEIINVMLGAQWMESVVPLQILTAGLIFRMGYKMGDCLTRATGNVYSRASRQFLYAMCVLLGCYIGSFWGINGVAMGTLFAVFVNYILMIHLSLVILKSSWLYFLKRISTELPISILLSLLFLIIITLIRLLFQNDGLILLFSYALFGGISMLLFYFYSHKLSFIKLLPFEKILKKITKNNN